MWRSDHIIVVCVLPERVHEAYSVKEVRRQWNNLEKYKVSFSYFRITRLVDKFRINCTFLFLFLFLLPFKPQIIVVVFSMFYYLFILYCFYQLFLFQYSCWLFDRCQPWTITLTGVLVIACSWLILHSVIVTTVVLSLISAWWYIFLYSYPKVSATPTWFQLLLLFLLGRLNWNVTLILCAFKKGEKRGNCGRNCFLESDLD